MFIVLSVTPTAMEIRRGDTLLMKEADWSLLHDNLHIALVNAARAIRTWMPYTSVYVGVSEVETLYMKERTVVQHGPFWSKEGWSARYADSPFGDDVKKALMELYRAYLMVA